MTLVNTATGEIVEFDRAAAERRAERIRLRLDVIADNYTAVMPMIREAIEKRDDMALGYRSVSEYVADRFGGALQNLGMDVRREVVRELTQAGMSTRAIAPVVGISHEQVRKDQRGVNQLTPAPQTPEPAPEGEAETGSGQTPEGEGSPGESPVRAPSAHDDAAAPRPPAPVVGIDGKTYPKPASSKPRRRPLPDVARDAGWDLRKSVERLERLVADDRFAANREQVAPHLRSHLTNAIEVCQDLLDRINN